MKGDAEPSSRARGGAVVGQGAAQSWFPFKPDLQSSVLSSGKPCLVQTACLALALGEGHRASLSLALDEGHRASLSLSVKKDNNRNILYNMQSV